MKRRAPRPEGSSKRVGLPRFRPEDWERWIASATDRQRWPATYADWQREAEAMAERLRRAGLEVVWVDLLPEPFTEWCQARGNANDAESRARFAAEQIGNIPPQKTTTSPGPPGGAV
jgi:hypothetical protein